MQKKAPSVARNECRGAERMGDRKKVSEKEKIMPYER